MLTGGAGTSLAFVEKQEGSRTRLNRDVICRAAQELLIAGDADSFSLRALGDHLGVDPTAFYRHFADKEDLLREVGFAQVEVLHKNGCFAAFGGVKAGSSDRIRHVP